MQRVPRNLSNQQREWLRAVPGAQFDDDLHDEDVPIVDFGDLQEEDLPQSVAIM